MEPKILKGADVAKAINEEVINGVKALGRSPRLAIVRVGERPDDLAYERGIIKKTEKLGMEFEQFVFKEDITNESFLKEFDRINADERIDGILLFRPLPKHIDSSEAERRIDPKKDLDGISPINMAKVYSGDESGFAPCTAQAVIEALKYENIELAGKNVTVIGRSLVIGKPVAMLLIKENATVTVCHTKTKDLAEKCRNADIIVAAAGKARMVGEDFVSEGQIVADVGINVDSEGNMCGDVDFDKVVGKTALITPVPGGIGSITTSVLMQHLLMAASNQ